MVLCAPTLQDLPGAAQRLSLFPGDVLQPWREGGLAAALGGCSGLLHLAAVVDLLPGAKQQVGGVLCGACAVDCPTGLLAVVSGVWHLPSRRHGLGFFRSRLL